MIGRWVDGGPIAAVAAQAPLSPPVKLSRRETEVLRLKATGITNLEAADMLYVSKRTIDFHLANIYEKLMVCNLVQALLAAKAKGLI